MKTRDLVLLQILLQAVTAVTGSLPPLTHPQTKTDRGLSDEVEMTDRGDVAGRRRSGRTQACRRYGSADHPGAISLPGRCPRRGVYLAQRRSAIDGPERSGTCEKLLRRILD